MCACVRVCVCVCGVYLLRCLSFISFLLYFSFLLPLPVFFCCCCFKILAQFDQSKMLSKHLAKPVSAPPRVQFPHLLLSEQVQRSIVWQWPRFVLLLWSGVDGCRLGFFLFFFFVFFLSFSLFFASSSATAHCKYFDSR